MWRVYLISGLIACVVAAVTAFVTVQLTKPVAPTTVTLEGEVEVDHGAEFGSDMKARVVHYKTLFASPPYLTFPEGYFGYVITEQKAESFKVERIGFGQGIAKKLKWKAEGQPAK